MNKVRFSTDELMKYFVNVVLVIGGIVSFLNSLKLDSRENFITLLFPFLDNITIIGWRIIFAIIVLFAVAFNLLMMWYSKKKKIEVQPHLKLVGCGTNDVSENIGFYGKNSFIAKGLKWKRDLIYFDIANIPPKKENGKSNATNVSFGIEFYDADDGNCLYKGYIGKWVKPETEDGNITGIDIPSDGIARRLGVGFMDSDSGSIFLLDADIAYFDNEFIYPRLNHISQYGKFVVVARITGNNIWDEPPMVFELSKLENEPIKFVEMEDGEYWLETAQQSNVDLWKSS